MTSTAGLILKLLIVVIGTICTSMQGGGTSTGFSSWHKQNVNIYDCTSIQKLLWHRYKKLRNNSEVILNSKAKTRNSCWTRFVFNDMHTHQMFGIKNTHDQWFFMQRVGNESRLIEGDYPNNVLPSNDRVFIVKHEAASDDLNIRDGNTYLARRDDKRIQFVNERDLAMSICFYPCT